MLSIIVPIYNGEKYLEQFLKNILNQTFKNFELILVNDGSKDNSKAICDKYKEIDSRIIIINKQNEGAGPARNKGLEIASGEYIMFIDCDDYFKNNYLESLYNTITTQKVDLVICGQVNVIGKKSFKYTESVPNKKIYTTGEEIRKDYIKLKKEGIADVLWNKIYKSDIIKNFNLRFPDLRRGQDTVFNINYFDKIKTCITLNELLYYYRINALNNIFEKFPENHYDIINKENLMIESKLIEWNVYDQFAQEYLSVHFIKAVIGAMTNAFNPKWNFSFSERYSYIKEIVNKERVKKSLYVKGKYSKYETIVIFFMKHDMIIPLMIMLKTKIFIKKSISFL